MQPVRLRELREQRFLTQAELAEKAGVSVVTVNRLETQWRGRAPRFSTMKRLAAALDVAPGELLGLPPVTPATVVRRPPPPAGTDGAYRPPGRI